MYNSQKIADRIKELTKTRNISVKQLLEEVGLGFNTMSNMKSSMPKADNLAKIADYLSCSVDYLLGRSDDPNMIVNISDNNQSNVNGNNSIQVFPIDDTQKEINSILSQLNPRERTELMMMIYQFADEHIAKQR